MRLLEPEAQSAHIATLIASKGLWWLVPSPLPRQEHRVAGCTFGSVDRRCRRARISQEFTEQLSTRVGNCMVTWFMLRTTGLQIKDRH